MKKTPFIAVGNDELHGKAGKTAKCPNCGKFHEVKYGDKRNEDGKMYQSKTLGVVNCDKKSYLVAIDGHKFN